MKAATSSFRVAFDALRRRVAAATLTEGLALLAGGMAVYLAVTLPLDRWLRLEVVPRFLLLAAAAVVLGRLLLRHVLRPLRRRLDEVEMALAVERAEPRLAQKLVSAVQFEDRLAGAPAPRSAESPELMEAVVRSVRQAAGGIPFGAALDARRLRRARAVAAGGLVVLACAFAAAPQTMALWAARNLALSSVEWPRHTLLRVVGAEEGRIRLPEGEDMTVMVDASGVVPEVATVHYRFEGGARGRDPMAQVGEAGPDRARFSFTFPSVLEGLRFHVAAGDGIAGPVEVVLVQRPRLQDLALTLHYPAYTGRPPRLLSRPVEDPSGQVVLVPPGDLSLVAGSRLEVRARSSKPVRRAWVLHGREEQEPLEVEEDGSTVRGSFQPRETGLFAVDVLDQDDLTTGQPPRILLRVAEDRPPRLVWRPSGIGGMVTPMARIPGSLRVEDDFGITALAAEARVTPPAAALPGREAAGAPAPGELPFQEVEASGLERFEPGAGIFEAEAAAVDLLETLNPDAEREDSQRNRAPPGSLLSLRFAARDNFGPGAPNEGHTEVVTVRVVTPAELLNDLLRRQEEQKRDFEVLIREERGLRAELAELASPHSPGALGERVRMRLGRILGHQRTIGRRVAGTADRYRQILDEMRNNRVGEAATIARLRIEIVNRLETLAEEFFPPSLQAVEGFLREGSEEARAAAVESCDQILAVMERVLGAMHGLETFLRVIEMLRDVLKKQDTAADEVLELRRRVGEEIFGPEEPPGGRRPPGASEEGRDGRAR